MGSFSASSSFRAEISLPPQRDNQELSKSSGHSRSSRSSRKGTKKQSSSSKLTTKSTTVPTSISSQQNVTDMSPTKARRHSLTYTPNSQQPKPLYRIRPENEPAPTVKTTVSALTPALSRRNSLGTPQDSLRSMGSHRSGCSALSAESHRSGGSAGSTFSSTGWSVASPNHSPSKVLPTTSSSLQKNLAQLHAASAGGGGRLGNALYTTQWDSNNSLESFESDS